MSGNFWDDFLKDATFGEGGSMDDYLSDRALEGEQFTGVRALTDKYRAKNALQLPVEAGTRVEFQGNVGAVLSYDDPPMPGTQGTVVTVRSATGDVTEHEGKVFVQWDDGKFRSLYAEHLMLAKKMKRRGGMNARIRVASLGDITDFLKVAEDTLIHRSTKDLWSYRRDGSEYVIERLFDDSGKPLKG